MFELVYNTGCVIFEGVEGDSLEADGVEFFLKVNRTMTCTL